MEDVIVVQTYCQEFVDLISQYLDSISKDSTLITTRTITDTYPGTALIYEMIGRLKKHVAEEGASMNNVPMLNVKILPGKQFQPTVAIPANRVLIEQSSIVNKHLVPWK